MARHLRMGVWTGLLGGVATALVALAVDLASGAGLDGASRVAQAAGLGVGVAAAWGVVAIGLPLVAMLLGLGLALLPPRAAGAGAGLLLGLVAGGVLSLSLLSGASRADEVAIVLLGVLAGLLVGFLYSRYARTRLRPAGTRPFGVR